MNSLFSKKPNTFDNQKKLSKLPVPQLDNTLATLIKTVKPLCSSDEEFEQFKELVDDFGKANGFGQTLQKRLAYHDANQKANWLEDWWLRDAYLTYRAPNCINVNWGCLAKEHPQRTNQTLEPFSQGFSRFQIVVASQLIHALVTYHEMLLNEQIEPIGGKFPQCMNQLKYMFGTTRIPDAGVDRVEHKFPTTASHVSVLIEGEIYQLEVYHLAQSGGVVERKVNTVEQLAYQLTYLIHHLAKPRAHSVAHMTAGQRDDWFRVRTNLLELDGANLESFESVQSSLFCFSLDNYEPESDLTHQFKNIHHGQNGKNRWFDKCMSVAVDRAGRVGLNGEHSPMDAMDLIKMLDCCLDKCFDNVVDLSLIRDDGAVNWEQIQLDSDVHTPNHVAFYFNEAIAEDMAAIEVSITKMVANSDGQALYYDKFGSRKILEHSAKATLDGFLQMAIQLAYFRMFDKLVPVYETAGTRNFLHGRTEAIRALSSEGKAFLEWIKPLTELDSSEFAKIDKTEGITLLSKACEAHKNYTKLCLTGRGIDRHLFGLKKLLKNGESHPLLESTLFKSSSNWKLSTSTLYEFKNLVFVGFGAVTADGFGICYNHQKDGLAFIIESKRDTLGPLGGTGKYVELLTSSLDLLMQLLEASK